MPASWRASGDGNEVSAPDGTNFSLRRFRISDWSQHKAQVRATFVHLQTVHEDSDHRFWFQFGNESTTTHYIAVRDGVNVCIALMRIPAMTTATTDGIVNGIVASIGPAFINP